MKNSLIILLLGIISNLSAQKITTDVQSLFSEQDVVDCIIVMDDQLDMYGKTDGLTKDEKAMLVFSTLKNHANRSQESLLSYLQSKEIKHESFYIFNGIQAYLSYNQAQYIENHFQISSIVYNEPAKVHDITSSHEDGYRMDAEWGILQINADSVWQLGYEGEGVVVGGQDTGYDWDNTLLVQKYRGYEADTIIHSYNWHDAIDTVNVLHNDTINDPSVNPCGFLSSEPCDDHGHGTHTMGTMVGSDDENQIGVAPKASWIGCRNMDRGWGKPSTYTECFEWFLAPTDLEGQNPDPTKAPDVINNSWGCPQQEGCNITNWSFMETVVNNLSAAGTVVVVSAGNSGNSGCNSVSNPAAIFENSFTVGASNDQDGKAGFSSIGPVSVDSSYRIKPDVVAPGVGVRSVYLNEQFRTWNGTSMAGPHVAGAVALIINANPALSGQVDEIKDILKSTAIPLTDSTFCDGNFALDVPNFYYGHGRIDVLAAVKKATEITSTQEIEDFHITVYPNPSNGTLNISTGGKININNLKIYDLSGKEAIYRIDKISNQNVAIDGLHSGIYIYSMIDNDGQLRTGKIIVTK